jgi:DHA3 family tetracycline resistance protein-like MFS transporter
MLFRDKRYSNQVGHARIETPLCKMRKAVSIPMTFDTFAILEQSPARHLPSKGILYLYLNTIATQAWIVDEIGEERAGEAFLRGSQAGQAGGLIAIPISIALGSVTVRLPILMGGGLMILLAAFLALTMTEEGFTPTPPEDRTTWSMMLRTVRDARQMVRRQPLLLALLGIGLFYGLYSEGFDRLWTPHLLENFALPSWLEATDPVVWFGIIQGVAAVVSLAATEVVRRRVDTSRSASLGQALMWNAGGIVLALVGFGLTRSFWVTALLTTDGLVLILPVPHGQSVRQKMARYLVPGLRG